MEQQGSSEEMRGDELAQALAPDPGGGDEPEGVEATEATEDAGTPPKRRRVRWRRVFRLTRYGLVILILLTALFFTQTGRGQRLVLDEVLERVRGSLAGELTVEGVRSGTLLLGLTLEGVRLDAEGGRPFLRADSLVVRYSPVSLAIGSPRIRSATFHGLHVQISRYPGDDAMNVNRLVAARAPGDTLPGAPQTFGLGRIAVRGGNVEILVPAGDAPSELTVPAPDGGHLRRMAFENLDLDLERTVLRTEGPVMVDARLASLSASVRVLEDPLVVREAQGDLTFGDRGVRIGNAAFRLSGSFLEGGVGFGPERPGDPWTLAADVRSDGWSDLGDLAWVDPRIPQGRFRGGAGIRIVDGIQVGLRDLDLETGGSVLTLDGDASFDEGLSVRGMRVAATSLDLAELEPWLGRELPFRGTLRGNATLGGTPTDLSATGRMTFTPEGLPLAATTADFSGTVHTGPNPGGTALDVRLDPFDYRVLEPVWADAARLGTGRVTMSVAGRADEGILVVADVLHRSSQTTTSRVVGRALVRRVAGPDWVVDVRGELAPLSLPLIGRLYPQVDLPGTVQGPVRVQGRLTDLTVSGDLTSESGRVVFTAAADMTDPAAGYVIDADAEDLDLSAFTTTVPNPSRFSGHVTIDGYGLGLDSLVASAEVGLRSALVGSLAIDSVAADMRVADGMLTAERLRTSVSGILVEGAGSIGLLEGRAGEANLSFSAETVEGLRPVFMGDSLLVADTLNPLEQDMLRARGIDPDTLPTAMDIRLAGAVQGTAEVTGSIRDLDVDLLFDLTGGAYGHHSVDSAHVSLVASGLPETRGAWDVEADARGVVFLDRRFEQVRFDGAMFQRQGEGMLDVVRLAGERYYLNGGFALDSVGGELRLVDAVVDVGDRSWVLGRPTAMTWNASSITVDSLEISRSGDDPMLVTAAGTLTRGGDSDFHLVMEGFHVEQALRIAQREDIDLSGHVDLALRVQGPAERPVIEADFDIQEPQYGSYELTRVDGTFVYRDLAAEVELAAWVGERRVLTGGGAVPVNLALTEVAGRSVDRPMDLTLRADSLNAGVALAYLSALEDVTGSISAEMRIRGTPLRPEPSGQVSLTDAAWTIDALGVRHRGVSGELILQPDRTVKVQLETTASSTEGGTSRVSGTVSLEPDVRNPALDLEITFDRFLAVDRRDMEGRISGELLLGGTYSLPVTEGTLRMDEATLFVEEFSRNAGIVDLRSPLMYAPAMVVDTTVFVSQPLIAGLSNPFLDNLRVDVDLQVPRNMWLRSREMSVEMGGDLIVRYDRAEGDLVLVGELQALRGSYVVLGRTFDVDGGMASFLGQPGINPSLDIQALSRVRRQDGDPLEVRATVGGTLVEPLVTLSSEEAGLSQSDLISYLLVGRPAGEIGRSGLGTDVGALAGTYLTGAVVSQLGTALAQDLPLVNQLDYLSFSQQAAGVRYDDSGAVGTVFGNTQVELGKYLNDYVFVIFVLGGEAGRDGDSGTSLTLRGVRAELALDELVPNLFLEGFVEDRLLRTGSALQGTDFDGEPVVGIFVFGEWGYGGSQQQDE